MKKGDLFLKIKIFKVLTFITVTILMLHTNALGYVIFNYNADSESTQVNENMEAKESNSSDIILLSTTSVQRLNPVVFMANLPAKGIVTSEYGYRWEGFHRGFDIAANEGTGIFAAANGVVEYSSELDTYGLVVKIDHGNGFETLYAHCSKLDVEVGQYVTRGDKIAEIGNTGNSTGNHVHFEVIHNGVRINPKDYFIQSPDYGV